MKKLLLLLSVVAATQASAQYVSQGPKGGTARHFYVDASRVWMAAGGGLFYSNDHGQSWNVSQTPPIPASCENLLSVAAFGNEIYVGAEVQGIMHSVDGGITWSLPGAGVQRGYPYTDIEVSGPNAIAIRGDNGDLLVTTDHGLSWVQMNFAIMNAKARSISKFNNNIYVSSTLGLFKSADNGLSYMQINPSLADTGMISWSHDTMYLASSQGLKMSIDDGGSFTPLGLAGTAVKNVASDERTVYATVSGLTQDTLKMSTDFGMTFSNAVPNPIPFGRVFDLAFSNKVALIGTDQGIFRNAGSSVQKSDSGFHATVINQLAVNGIRLYAATSPMGVFYTADSAENWSNIGGRPQGVPGDILTIDARNNFVHAGGPSGYYRSTDFGVTWTAGATGLPAGAVRSIAVTKGSPQAHLILNGSVYATVDDGASWFALSSTPFPAGSTYLITWADSLLFVASTSGLYRYSSSTGYTLATGISGLTSAVVTYKNNFYASTHSNGLFTSPDGYTWTAVNPAPGTLPLQIKALVVKDNALFAGTEVGLFTDSTGIWTADSLQGQVVHSLAVMDNKLYAGTCSGVWSLKNLPPPLVGVNTVAKQSTGFTAYPNPARTELHVAFQSDKTQTAVLSMQDMMGRRIWTRNVELKAGKNEWMLTAEVSNLPGGVYILQISGNGNKAQQRIVLQGR